MEFSDSELKVVLQALHRFRGEVSGFSQSEQNKLGLVEAVIGKIEGKVGTAKAEKTRFDREMEESLAVLKTGRVGAGKAKTAEEGKSAPVKGSASKKIAAPAKAKAAKPAKAKTSLDKGSAAPKVKKGSGSAKPGTGRKTKS